MIIPDDYPRWSEDFRIGVPELDNDHRQLIDTLVELIEHPKPTYAELVEMTSVFVEHATEHFAREERLMRSLSYPGTEDHMASHRVVQELFIDKLRPFLQGDLSHHDAVNLYLHLFYDHVKLHDVKFVTFLRDHGIKL